MEELQTLQANTTFKSKELMPTFEDYKFVKTTHTGDFAVRDKLSDHFLICQIASRHMSNVRQEELANSHLVTSLQVLEEKGNYFEVFPIDLRLVWSGDVPSLKTKSQLYCLSVLYSAIKHIIKPLADSTILHPQKYISIKNVWLKDNACFLFLCNRVMKKKPFFKTEKTEILKKEALMKTGQLMNVRASRQIMIVTKMGEIFWQLFYDKKDHEIKQKKAFHEILKGMIKGQLKIQHLQKIMESKMAKKKFLSSLSNKKRIIGLDQMKATVSLEKHKQTIDYGTLYNKLDNIPMTIGKPSRRMLIQKKGLGVSPCIRSPAKLDSLLDSTSQNYPPSFTKVKRHKRLSLFSENRFGSCKNRTGSFSLSKQLQTLKFPSKTVSIGDQTSQDLSRDRYLRYNTISSNKAALKKEKRILKEFFESQEYELTLTNPKESRIEQRSKQKMLKFFKKNTTPNELENDDSIDDRKFLSQIKAKKLQLVQNLSRHSQKMRNFQNQQDQQGNTKISHIIKLDFKNGFFLENKHQKSKEISTLNGHSQNKSLQIKVHNENLMTVDEKNERSVKCDDYFCQSPTLVQNIGTHEQKSKNSNYRGDFIKKIPIDNDKVFQPSPLGEEKREQLSLIPNQKNIEQPILKSVKNERNIQKSVQGQGSNLDYSIKNTEKDEFKVKQEKNGKSVRFNPKVIISEEPSIRPETKVEKNLFQKFNESSQDIDYEASQEKIKPMMEPNAESQKDREQCNINEMNKEKKEENIEKYQKQGYYFGSQQEIIQEVKEPEGITYVSRQKDKSKQSGLKDDLPKKNSQKEIQKVKPSPIKTQKSMKNIYSKQHEDEIEQISFPQNMMQKAISPLKPHMSEPKIQQAQLPQKIKLQTDSNSPKDGRELRQVPKEKGVENRETQKIDEQGLQINRRNQERKNSQDSKGGERMRTGQSNASSTGNKSVRKQIEEYVFMVNKMGEAVAKTSKISKKLEGVDWYTGLYFLYKRFFNERRKIEKYLLEEKPYLTRYEPFAPQEWREWLSKGEKETLLKKYQDDNKNILSSLTKMSKKMEMMKLPASTMNNINLYKNMEDSSLTAVDYIISQYDQLVEKDMLKDADVFGHICEMINGLLVMAEIDKKIKQRKPVTDYANTKRTLEDLDELVRKIEQYYEND